MTLEQIEIMREKFEGNITPAGRAKNGKDKYLNSLIENQWKGFQWGYEEGIKFQERVQKDIDDLFDDRL